MLNLEFEAQGGMVEDEAAEITPEGGSTNSFASCNERIAPEEARQMLALFQSVGAENFLLTWRTMDDQTARVRKHWGTPYILRQMPELLAEAEQAKFNLFIRPQSARTSFIQLDDLTPEKAALLASVSFLTLQTSPAKAQTWIALPTGPTPDDDRDFRRRVKKAARSDPMASGSVRIAGSLNFKPRYAPNFPRVTITHANHALIASREALEAGGYVSAPEAPPAVLLRSGSPLRSRRAWPDYQQALAGAPANQSKSGPDRSLADFTWCLTALSWGWSAADVAAKLPQVSEKAAAQGERYALTTTQQAARAVAARQR